MILGEMCVLSLIYGLVAVCWFCTVLCLIIRCFYLLFSNYPTYVFVNILFMSVLFGLYFCSLFRVLYLNKK
jgi:hypothetical protein